jgi:hypothetical protein
LLFYKAFGWGYASFLIIPQVSRGKIVVLMIVENNSIEIKNFHKFGSPEWLGSMLQVQCQFRSLC